MPDTKQIPTSYTFEGIDDFEAYNKAEAFLKSAGFSIGSMCRGELTGIMYGDYRIAKWRNLTAKEKDDLHGQITSESFRNGPVVVDFYDDAPQEVIAALAKAAA